MRVKSILPMNTPEHISGSIWLLRPVWLIVYKILRNHDGKVFTQSTYVTQPDCDCREIAETYKSEVQTKLEKTDFFKVIEIGVKPSLLHLRYNLDDDEAYKHVFSWERRWT